MDFKKNICPMTIMALLTILLLYAPCYCQEDEETYDISLVKTADPDNAGKIHEVDGRKVLTESYTVKDGEHLWQILREKKLLEKKNLVELLSVLKKLNGSLDNLDMIHPGESIVIPIAISPAAGGSKSSKTATVETIPLEAVNNIDLEEYVVKQGDSVIKVVEDLYDVPEKQLYNEYLSTLKRMNPDLKDLNSVYPGQKIRLPIYSPKVVRLPIKKTQPVSEPMTEVQKELAKTVAGQIGEVFTLMGEQWLQTGEHFFPLKTGGQLKLNAESYPIVDLRSGKKIIVDVYNDLPARMGSLITSNWGDYDIIHLGGNDDLKTAFDKIINVCGYKKIYGPGEPFVSGGEIPLKITADRIIELDRETSSNNRQILAINFCDEDNPRIPDVIRNYLESSGIRVVDYPLLKVVTDITPNEPDVVEAKVDRHSFVETLLNITGQNYSTNVELPVYQNGKGDVDLVVKADYSININDKVYIIDTSGLGKDIVSLLKDHQHNVYSISDKASPSDIATGILDFLDIKQRFDLHRFLATNGPETKNIILDIQGISFQDKELNKIFATTLKMPRELSLFLNMKGYRVLQLPAGKSLPREESK